MTVVWDGALGLLSLASRQIGLDAGKGYCLFFDREGGVVPPEEASKGAPGGTNEFGVEYWIPTPGTGFYAYIRMLGANANSSGFAMETYRIEGPDWRVDVSAHATPGTNRLQYDLPIVQAMSEEGEDFLGKFAQLLRRP